MLWCYYSEETSLGEILRSRLLNIFYKNIDAEICEILRIF